MRAQQRRLAGAVAADEPDALAVADRQVGAVEQRVQAERELGIANGQHELGRSRNVGYPVAQLSRKRH